MLKYTVLILLFSNYVIANEIEDKKTQAYEFCISSVTNYFIWKEAAKCEKESNEVRSLECFYSVSVGKMPKEFYTAKDTEHCKEFLH